MKKMGFNSIADKMRSIKKQRRPVISNYYNTYHGSESLFDVEESDDTLIFCIWEEKVYRLFYYSCNAGELGQMLEILPKGTIADCITKVPEDEFPWLEKGGFCRYGVFERYYHWAEDKFETPEVLLELYDENCGEYAVSEDAEELLQIIYREFDYKTNHLFSMEELKNLISKKQVLVKKLDDIIVSIFIYKIEGKKYYANLVYNELSADISYNLETKAFNYAREHYDINYIYAWYDHENKRAMRRNRMKPEGVFNYVFEKQ